MFKAYVEAYGCSSNIADEEAVFALLKKKKFLLVNNPAVSDVNIILTCAVKLPTVNRMIDRIQKLTSMGKPLIVAGCLTKVRRNEIEKINPKASLLSPDWVERVEEAATASIAGKKIVLLEDVKKPKLSLPRYRINPVIAIVQIGRGCLSNCSYCEEPYRGKLFSYPLHAIVKEVKSALEEGCREVWLTSLDNGCYGFDLGVNLTQLLDAVCKLDGKFFIRVGMANPSHVSKILDNLVQTYRDEKVYKFLHIPIQSASDSILKLMKRGYRLKDFLKIVKRFREEFVYLTLSTDVIVGFPGESSKDFRKTLEFVKRVEPDIVNLSKFGPHPGTVAATMPQLKRETINKRTKRLFETIRKVQLRKNEKWIGWKGEILVDEKGKNNSFVGRNFAYKPIVVESKKNLLGKFLEVKVVDARSNYLLGELDLNIRSTY